MMYPGTERDRARGFGDGPFSKFERIALDRLHAMDDAAQPHNDDQNMDDGPLHITYATATQPFSGQLKRILTAIPPPFLHHLLHHPLPSA